MPEKRDITGYRRTPSGAVYHFFRETGHVVATFHRPSACQASCGIRAGDL
jgi:hypothetical protein